MKKRNKFYLRKLLFVSSLSLWVVVFLASFIILRTGGNLLPQAANLMKSEITFPLEGKINDSGGLGISGAKVIIIENSLKHIYISDSRGQYIVYNLASGSYKINVEATGYKEYSNIILIDRQLKSTQDFILYK